MKSSVSKKLFFGSVNNIIIIIICLVFAAPFVWMFLSSFKTGQEIIQIPPTFFPKDFTFDNYLTIFKKLNFGRYFLNSLIVSSATTILAVFTSSLAGYVFAKYNFRWKNVIFIFCIAGLMVPLATIILPMYLLILKIGLGNSYIGLILPFMISPFGIFLMRQFTEGIPIELVEAARLDGAGEFKIYYKIIVPLTSAAMGAVGIFTFLFTWNQLWWPMMIISKSSMNTLPLGVAGLAYQFGKRFDMIVTGASISILPVMIIFALAQKQMIKGVTLTGMKM